MGTQASSPQYSRYTSCYTELPWGSVALPYGYSGILALYSRYTSCYTELPWGSVALPYVYSGILAPILKVH
jgi:hypothetical protein